MIAPFARGSTAPAVLAWACAVLALSPRAEGIPEGGEDKKPKPDRLVRILPLGEAPPFRQIIEEGRRQELPAPPGSIPPREVVQMTPEGGELGDPVRLWLDRPSASIPARAGALPLHEKGKKGLDPKTWHTLKVPAKTTHALALLWRDPELKKWDKARSMTLKDDVRSFPAGHVRFVNVSPWPVGIEFNGQKGKLEPGKVLQRRNVRGALRVLLKNRAGNWQPVFHQAVNQAAGQRTNVFIYRADGEAPRRPAKVVLINEPARLPKPPNPNEG